MARLPAVAPETLGLATRFWFWVVRRIFGRVLRPHYIVAHAPRMVPATLLMSAFFGAGNWQIGPTLRTLIHLRVASLIGCVF